MELSICFRNSNGERISERVKIKSYNVLSQHPNLLLTKEKEMEWNVKGGATDSGYPFVEIFKVQFIASCETRFSNALVVAFYLIKEVDTEPLRGYVIAGLPDEYENDGDPVHLLDYQGYLEACNLTGETKASFMEFYKAKRADENYLFNSLLIHDGKTMNRDEQEDFYRQQMTGVSS